ncbi:multidrug ABC transporter ATP-binding protein [Pedobacter sp. KBW06]|uniref:ABC transporter ATP-binding protein n=1 Tax=Pedobacter sp. KBW06 TaxID=2153359 RepID=UPI000F5AA356|nr:ATP-binding cassette domain-containing protein [Pedobacter sp. KBW06]RQO74476.1 multidrug ABC transporter ATP-binding protein [Pedobacter sp. KBW06]
MNKSLVKIEHLSHRYGKDWAIQDINFEIDEVGVLGLLGSNGAGKSTTMNILCGVLKQTSGKVLIDGMDLAKNPELTKRLLGFLPQNAPLYYDFTVDEYLNYCAYLRDIDKKNVRKAVDEVKEKCGVTHFSKRLLSNLSGGYRQRVGIAQAIIHKPKLVVLDEPTNGLDPNQILEVRNLIKEIAEERSVIFSTHILSEVQATCKKIRMIEKGKMVFADTIEAFNNYIQPDAMLVNMLNPPTTDELMRIPGVSSVEWISEQNLRIRFKPNYPISEKIVEQSVQQGWHLTELILEKSSMEEIFAQLSNKAKSRHHD